MQIMNKNSPWHFREIEREMRARIEAMGFIKRGPVFEKELGVGFRAVIGFNRDRLRDGRVGINPVLGVSCHVVYKHLCVYLNATLDRADIVSSPLGYLTPDARYRDWHVTLGEHNQGVLDEMFDAIRQYGFPFYEAFHSIDAMIEAIELKTCWHPHWAPYAYPIMLVMKRRLDDAVKYVEAERDRRSGIGGGYEDDYRRFTENFLKDVDADRTGSS